MHKLSIFLLLMLCPILSTYSQSSDSTSFREDTMKNIRTHCSMLGIGSNNQLDTYLSPLEYTGKELRFVQENIRFVHLFKKSVSLQNLIQVNGCYTKSPTDDGKYMSGMVDWNLAGHLEVFRAKNLFLMVGPQTGLHAGFIYNTRNGNNPAQARLAGDLGISGKATYSFFIKKHHFTLRYQADLPLAGLMFSPEYGQSYYEIFSLGNSGHNVCFTNPFEALTLNQFLTLDVPLGSVTLRLGYESCIRQSHVNEIKTHDWTNLFVIGVAKHFVLVKDNGHKKFIPR